MEFFCVNLFYNFPFPAFPGASLFHWLEGTFDAIIKARKMLPCSKMKILQTSALRFTKTRSTISMQSVCLHKESSIPSRFAPRSPVMRHQPIPCFHYSKRHGQILSMPQHSSYESFHKSVHKGFTDSSFCAPYSQFLLKAEYLPHANHHIHHKKTHPCVS